MSSSVDSGADALDTCDLRVFTLNIWGLKGVSAKRSERVKEIGEWLAASEFDVVLLQEVWLQEDFDSLRRAVRGRFQHAHFFDNGIIGTGTCIFSRVRIFDATFHEFSMNGYPHKIFHGDWFGGKGLGVCQIMFQGFDIHVYTSHYHAEYNRRDDVYLGHRVIHALESAQWIKLASSSADLTVYAGDFNSEPVDVPYKMLRSMTPLKDCWEEAHGGLEGGETNATPRNSFTSAKELQEAPEGKRIDYVMYLAGPNVEAETLQCSHPLPDRCPGKDFSYSDHEGVSATIRLKRRPLDHKGSGFQRAPEYRRLVSRTTRHDCVRVVADAQAIIARSSARVRQDKTTFILLATVFLLLFVASFLPGLFLDAQYFVILDVSLFLPRVVVTVGVFFFILMATLFNKKEQNGLASADKTLTLVANQDAPPKEQEAEANGGQSEAAPLS